MNIPFHSRNENHWKLYVWFSLSTHFQFFKPWLFQMSLAVGYRWLLCVQNYQLLFYHKVTVHYVYAAICSAKQYISVFLALWKIRAMPRVTNMRKQFSRIQLISICLHRVSVYIYFTNAHFVFKLLWQQMTTYSGVSPKSTQMEFSRILWTCKSIEQPHTISKCVP